MKHYAKQKRSFLRGGGAGDANKAALFKGTGSKSRSSLYQTAAHEEKDPADMSVLFSSMSMSQTMKRAASGLRSTTRTSTAGRLAGNQSQFLVSQQVNMSALDPSMGPELLQSFTHQSTGTNVASRLGGTPAQQQSNRTTSRMKPKIPKKTQFIKRKKGTGAKRAQSGLNDEQPLPDQVEIGFEGTFQGDMPALAGSNQEASGVEHYAPPPANPEPLPLAAQLLSGPTELFNNLDVGQ